MSQLPVPLQSGQLPKVVVPIVDQAAISMDQLENPFIGLKTCLDVTDPENAPLLSKCLGQADAGLSESTSMVLLVYAWVAQVVQVNLEQEQCTVNRVRMTLVTEDGNTISWTSPITTQKFAQLIAIIGNKGPWMPGIPIRIVATKGKRQGYWYGLELANLSPKSPSKGKKGS